MGTPDVVLTVGYGVVAVLNVALGTAMLVRSRHQPDATLWRGKRVVAPRLAACVSLFSGLTMATIALRDVFEPRSNGDDLLFLAGTVFAVATIVTGVMWFVIRFLRRGRTAQHPTPP